MKNKLVKFGKTCIEIFTPQMRNNRIVSAKKITYENGIEVIQGISAPKNLTMREVVQTVAHLFPTQKDCAEALGISQSSVSRYKK